MGGCDPEPKKRKKTRFFLFHYDELERWENVAIAYVIILKLQASNSGKRNRKEVKFKKYLEK